MDAYQLINKREVEERDDDVVVDNDFLTICSTPFSCCSGCRCYGCDCGCGFCGYCVWPIRYLLKCVMG
jgi:hypothetical protein